MDDAAHTELLRARRTLDRAYAQLYAVQDGSLPIPEIDAELSQALLHAYEGLGASGDAELFAQALQAARARTRAALTLLREPLDTEDEAFPACADSTDQALRELMDVRYQSSAQPLALPRVELGDATLPPLAASVHSPMLLDPARAILTPTLPLAPLEQPDEAAPDVKIELSDAEPITIAELEARMAEAARDADAEPDPAPGGDDDDDDEAGAAPPAADGGRQPDAPPDPFVPKTQPEAAALEKHRYGELQRQHEVGFERARLALEELGMLAAMRRPDDDDPWTSNQECERRILCRVDAIIAAGTLHLPRLVRLLADRPVPDPELWLAICFVLGSIAGADTRDEIARLIEVSALSEPDVMVALCDALALAPHPGVVQLSTEYLAHPEPARRALGVTVLGRKRVLEASAWSHAAEDQALLVQRAAAQVLRKQTRPVAPEHIGTLLRLDDHDVLKDTLYGAALRGDARALERAMALVLAGRAAHGNAALICALCGGPEQYDVLASDQSPATLSALGWYGHVGFVPGLLDVLDKGSEAQQLSAAEALQRISGLALEDGNEPAYLHDPAAAPFLDEYREPRLPSELSLDGELWRKHIEANLPRARSEKRYRYGRPFSGAHELWEITQTRAVRCDRESAYLELRVRFGVSAPFDPDAFVLVQRTQLAQIGSELALRAALPRPWHTTLAARPAAPKPPDSKSSRKR